MSVNHTANDHVVNTSELNLPPGCQPPDYTGNSIVNLMSSIGSVFGMQSQWAKANILNEKALGRRIVMLVIDGLGIEHLRAGLPNGYLSRHCIGSLTSVSPSATAAAIPVYLTGEPPAVHGFPGWFTWFEELATTVAILPFATRAGYLPLAHHTVSPAQLSGIKPITSRINAPSWIISPKRIAYSSFSEDFRGNATTIAYDDIEDLINSTLKACKKFNNSGYVYAYWADYDHTAHNFGVASQEAQEHLEMLDEKIEKLAAKLNGLDIDLLVSADHGFIDCPDDKQFVFDRDFPHLRTMLKMPLTGEPRLASAHLRYGQNENFIQIANNTLQGIATAVKTENYVNAGMLGGRALHKQLLNRMGDVVLIPYPNTVLYDPLPGEKPPCLIGHHGGLSSQEMLVPLIHHRC